MEVVVGEQPGGAPVQGMFDRGYDDGHGKRSRMRVGID